MAAHRAARLSLDVGLRAQDFPLIGALVLIGVVARVVRCVCIPPRLHASIRQPICTRGAAQQQRGVSPRRGKRIWSTPLRAQTRSLSSLQYLIFISGRHVCRTCGADLRGGLDVLPQPQVLPQGGQAHRPGTQL